LPVAQDVVSIAGSSINDDVETVVSINSDLDVADIVDAPWASLNVAGSTDESEATVLAVLAASPKPPWVQAAVAVFGLAALGHWGMMGRQESILQRRRQLQIVHDCRGIDAVSEALRHLHVAGLLMEAPTIIAFSERCPAARAWTRLFHPAVPVEYHDMCHRAQPTPASDLYCNGFPCTPFSTRRGDKSRAFDDPNARPFWATLSEISAAKHKAILLENVCGLLTRTYKGERCIDVLLREVRTAAAGRYHIHLTCGVGPDAFGEACKRPRVFVRMMLKSACLVDSEEEFVRALRTADEHMARVAMSLEGSAASAGDRLQRAGLLAVPGPMVATGIGFCPCCLPLLPGLKVPVCQAHARPRQGRQHSWIGRHQQAWAKLVRQVPHLMPATVLDDDDDDDDDVFCDKPPRSFFLEAHRRGLPAGVCASTPRLRNLVELVAHDLWVAGIDPFTSDAAFDASQSYGRHALRTDGHLPTLATSSRIWLMKHGVVLAPEALLNIMGFPLAAYRPRLSMWTDTELRRFVGNTMHPAAVGPMLASLLNLLRGGADTVGEDDE
jgi:site-specific DNA-cytosine methylase